MCLKSTKVLFDSCYFIPTYQVVVLNTVSSSKSIDPSPAISINI